MLARGGLTGLKCFSTQAGTDCTDFLLVAVEKAELSFGDISYETLRCQKYDDVTFNDLMSVLCYFTTCTIKKNTSVVRKAHLNGCD